MIGGEKKQTDRVLLLFRFVCEVERSIADGRDVNPVPNGTTVATTFNCQRVRMKWH